MEERIKKQSLIVVILTVVGYFVGTTVYVLMGKDNAVLKFFSGVLLAFLLSGSFGLYEKLKYPGMKEKKRLLAQDERNIVINAQSAYYALIITLVALAILFLVGVVIKHMFMAYFSAGLYLFMIMVMGINRYYWNNKI